jgi:hypothetical protein
MSKQVGRIWFQSHRHDKLSCRQVPFAILNVQHHESSIKRFQRLKYMFIAQYCLGRRRTYSKSYTA